MNELARPTLQVDLDVEIPKIPVLDHNLGVVESFATELSTFYNELLDDNALSVKDIKAERTKVRKIMTTIADNRKKTVKAYKEPIQDFEDTSKRIEISFKEKLFIFNSKGAVYFKSNEYKTSLIVFIVSS